MTGQPLAVGRLRSRLALAGWAGLAGIAHALAFAPWGTWWLALAVLVGYALLLARLGRSGARPGRHALAGWAFGLGWFLAGVGWLFISMHTYGGMPAPLAGLALLLFAGYLGLFPALAAWLVARTAPAASGLRFALAFAALMTLAELARGWLFTGFPWLAIGYAQIDGPLAGFAPVGGVHLVGFATALLAGCLAALPAARRGAPAVALLVVAGLVLGVGLGLGRIAWSDPHGQPLTVRLVQGNVPQRMKFEAETVLRTMQAYRDQIIAEPAGLTVLPETAWTAPWSSTPPAIAADILAYVRDTGTAVAIGMPLIGPPAADARASGRQQPSISNSVLLLDASAISGSRPPQRYDKRHLVPFGEFVPWGFRWFVDLMTIPLGDFARGAGDQPPFAVADQRIAFNICYEDVFGEELLATIRRPGDGATMLANVSNIGWFGRSHALPQHLQIARMRSLETARPTIRSTNTGVTAAIDHRGRVEGRLPDHETGILVARVQGRTGLTPYTRFGNLPVLVLALVLAGLAALPERSHGRKRKRPLVS